MISDIKSHLLKINLFLKMNLNLQKQNEFHITMKDPQKIIMMGQS
jgi:hypothetical protein